MVTGVWDTKAVAVTAVNLQNPEDIKGSMTLKDVSNIFKVDAGEILQELGLPANADQSLRLRDLAEKNNVNREEIMTNLREIVKKKAVK